jgi:predicted membrane-bound spermidine synthase
MSIGFLSLSQEILWVRVVSFTLKGLSQSFAIVLFCFLVGIAVGSAIGKRMCHDRSDLLRVSAAVLGLASLIDVGLVFLLPAMLQSRWGLAAVLLLVALTAGLKSVLFPIAHHLGSQQSGGDIGRSVSKVYFGNILGSTMGPIVTGYILLDHLTVDECLLLVGLGSSLLSLLCAIRSGTPARGGAIVAIALGIAAAAWSDTSTMIASIADATSSIDTPGRRVEHIVQNRHGIIHTVHTPDGAPDTVLGGNIYDGRINVLMDPNYNGLDRALVMLAVHPKPRRVLVIGMSTGAWARILSASPGIEELVIVEINPGYLQLVEKYPQVAGLLRDPRVRIVIDDGRRWLRRHPDETFDLVVQNTTFYWRANATSLLSKEYMQLVTRHLRPGGIAGFNSTLSSDVLETARRTFRFVERRDSFIYGAMTPFSSATPNAESALRDLVLDGERVFSPSAFLEAGLARDMIDRPFVPHDEQLAGLSPSPGVITDQNLLVEHAHGKLREFLPALYRTIEEWRGALHR